MIPRLRKGGKKKGHEFGTWGLGGWAPGCLQGLASVEVFVGLMCVVIGIQGTYLGYTVSVLTNIERRFEISSRSSGTLLSLYDVGHTLAVVLVGHFGGHNHKPRWTGAGVVLSLVAMLGLSLPNFVFGAASEFELELVEHHDRYVQKEQCQPTRPLAPLDPSGCEAKAESTAAYAILAVSQLLAGVGAAPFNTLAYIYVDENVEPRRSPFFLGLLTSMYAFGPALGFALGAGSLSLYADPLSPIPEDLHKNSPNWVGAWWLGFLVCAALYLVVGPLLFAFPASLPSAPRLPHHYSQHYQEMVKLHQDGRELDGEIQPPGLCEREEVISSSWILFTSGWSKSWILFTARSPLSDRTATSFITTRPGIDASPLHTSSKRRRYLKRIGHFPELSRQKTHSMRLQIQLNRVYHQSHWYRPRRQESQSSKRHGLRLGESATSLPAGLGALLRNPVYVSMVLGWVFGSYLVGGYGTYLPKYVETQFGQSSSAADLYAGLVSIGSVAVSTALGGALLTKFDIHPQKATFLLVGSWSLLLLTYLVGMGTGCQQPTLAGAPLPSGTAWNFSNPCNAECRCEGVRNFDPVCDANGTTHFSPCHAGCVYDEATRLWDHCICAPAPPQAMRDGHVEAGWCPLNCSNLPLYVGVMFVGLFLGNLFFMTTMMVVLRSVEDDLKALALSFASCATNLLGFIPAPIVFGAVVDSSCLVWHSLCEGSKGGCILYDAASLRHRFHLGNAGFQLLAVLAALAAGLWPLWRGFTFPEDRPWEEGDEEEDWDDTV